ncbi:hypothetical protein D6W19_003110 [Escherichia coli]|nr:hypothetical protein [Escherichia coli]
MTGFTEKQQERKTIFLVNVQPFAHRQADEPVASFIYERELIEETDHAYIAKTPVYSGNNATYLRRDYVGFNTREEALIHLDRLALDKVQELESQLSHWQQFINAVDEELRK